MRPPFNFTKYLIIYILDFTFWFKNHSEYIYNGILNYNIYFFTKNVLQQKLITTSR